MVIIFFLSKHIIRSAAATNMIIFFQNRQIFFIRAQHVMSYYLIYVAWSVAAIHLTKLVGFSRSSHGKVWFQYCVPAKDFFSFLHTVIDAPGILVRNHNGSGTRMIRFRPILSRAGPRPIREKGLTVFLESLALDLFWQPKTLFFLPVFKHPTLSTPIQSKKDRKFSKKV